MHPDTHNASQQQGLVLPTPLMQSQIHELAKTLPPPRKQNTACDACRSRKVKCNRLPGHEMCQHCLAKNYPCTHFVQQATSERKRTQAMSRRSRNINTVNSNTQPLANQKNGLPFSEMPPNLPLMVRYGLTPPITASTPTRDVLEFIFAPPEASVVSVFPPRTVTSPYDPWGEVASKLEEEKFRAEYVNLPRLTLILSWKLSTLRDFFNELPFLKPLLLSTIVFFQIVHTRLPLLNPEQFRSRLQLQTSTTLAGIPPLHPALVAVILAWGTKFSEHPVLIADRSRPNGQSLMAKTLIDRARDLAEALKVHRIPSSEHVVIALLIEPLQSQNPDDPSGHHGFWLHTATRHLLDLGINHKSVMVNIQDPENRGTMIFAWWMTCICDAYASAYYRRKPVLDDDDYDIDFYTADPVTDSSGLVNAPSPREQLEFLGYYRAAHSLARTARNMSRQLWRPSTDSDGIPFETLCTFITALSDWRDQYLTLVGVPNNFEGEWDFVSAVSSCASDATYHIMWIILFNALDDFGIKELNSSIGHSNHTDIQIETTKRKIADEALHGALRIAGLASVLTSNGYLRLDTAVMHISLIFAGHLLARLGRPEVTNCISGLKQYSYAYEESGDQANEIHRAFNRARGGEFELNHMASTALRTNSVRDATHSPPNLVDDHQQQQQQLHRPNGPSHAFGATAGMY